MSELISREKAIALFKKYEPYMAVKTAEYGDALNILPYVETIYPEGEWNYIGDNLFRCNVCGYIADAKWLKDWKQKTTDPIFPKFCPSCGAMMKQSTE